MLQNATSLKKSAPWPPIIFPDPFQMPHACHRFEKCYKSPHVLHTFTHKTASNRPKVVRTCGAFEILTSKSTSRHNRVRFFDISTSESGLGSVCVCVCIAHFDLDMCFVPQVRATLHLSSSQMAPRRPLQRAYFSTLCKSLQSHSVSGLSYLFARLHLLSLAFSSLICFSSLLFSGFLFWLSSMTLSSLIFICPYCREFDFWNSSG